MPLAELTRGGPALPASFGDALAEQRAARTNAGIFDFSFMGCVEVRGPGAVAFMQRLQCRDLAPLATGRLAYTLLLRPDGTVLNDATAWRLGERHYRLVTGRRADIDHVRSVAAGFEVLIEDCSERRAAIAVQGPRSARLLARCGSGAPPGYFGFTEGQVLGQRCEIARIGYTGELGYELFVEPSRAPDLWDGLRDAGGAECGLEAADALRIEAGFILFSRELAVPVTPFEIGLGRLLAPKRRFLGADALPSWRQRGLARVLVGLVPTGQRPGLGTDSSGPGAPPPPGTGALTSSAYSALFGATIAMGYVHPEDRYPGTRVALQTGAPARVARLPFYDPVKRVPHQAI